ncbi:RUN and FYVE domain-containing protein 2 [Halotydeus destructor]|nr:RUN and FYVE domain-containing protein 2 [Halotydeus destructor]
MEESKLNGGIASEGSTDHQIRSQNVEENLFERLKPRQTKVPLSDSSVKHSLVLLQEDPFDSGYHERSRHTSVERTNILHLQKLVVKELLEHAMKQKRVVEFHEKPVRHFFSLLEMALNHGLKNRKSLLSSRKDLWHLLEIIQLKMPEASTITTSARDLPNAKSNIGRARAWLRLAFMQKLLPDYFKYLLDRKDSVLREFYEEDAFMMNDEATILGGLLIGLNVLDAHGWCGKDEDLDMQRNLIDLRAYLKDGSHINSFPDSDQYENVDLKQLLDQKNYLEEVNRHLQATIEDLKRKETISHVDPVVSKTPEPSVDRLSPDVLNVHRRTPSGGSIPEKPSVNGEKISIEEDVLRKDLESQIRMNEELETAMRLLETDIHEKQDTIISLRRQLDDIKTINLQLYSRLKDSDSLVKSKEEICIQLQGKLQSDSLTIDQLQKKVSAIDMKREQFEEVNRKQMQQLLEIDNKRLSTEGDLKIEREWRTSLKQIVDDQQEQIKTLQVENDVFKRRCHNFELAQSDFDMLKKKCADYELSLEELGVILKDSKLEVDDLKESSGSILKAVWADDKHAIDCCQCLKPFSVARRKHHCRNCGNIYCASCSDNKLPLPSSAKPVRVCDGCHTLLLERYSAK